MARILVVDDNPANLDLMLYLLRAFGYDCDGAGSAAAALAKTKGTPYNLAVVDVLMPEMDGCELARRLKSDPATAAIPLVAVTALAMQADRERILACGFAGYISKPIDPQQFVRQIEAYLGSAARSSKAVHERTGRTSPSPEPAGPVVLVVDDLQVNLDVVRATLAPFGYRVVQATSVAEALALMERIRPAVILCDLHMPGEGGFALIEKVRASASWRTIPFAFLSSTAWQTKDRSRGIELGANAFILRPIDPQRLHGEIEDLIHHGDGTDRR